ncbi:MAG: hypothetical protein IKU34_10585 [Clostridia bacterium]|nr:hypothetical protein [Clostridia bacterium]
MKKFVCLLAALLLLTSCALAEEYVTLAELREQAKAGWDQTYTAKGREVVVNVELDQFPDVDACPLLTVESITIDEKDPRMDKWKEREHCEIYNYSDRIGVYVRNSRAHRLIDNYRGKTLQDEAVYNHGEVPDHDAEDCDVTYEEFLSMFLSDVNELTGVSPEEISIDEVWVKGPVYKAKKSGDQLVRGDKIIATGCYHVFAHQLMHGIPVLGANQAIDKGYFSYHYYQPQYRYFTFFAVRETAVKKDDLPLLSFDAFKGKLEKLIDTGKLRGVDAMRFGYGTCKDGNEWKLIPVWMVTCGYTSDPSKENVMPYIDKDGDNVIPETYKEYYFNAQTGELMERYEVNRYEESLRMPKKILTWDDVN